MNLRHAHAAIGFRGWLPERRHIRDLVATLDTKHHEVTFELSGTEHPIWLCPSTFDNPYPVHVHRHLAVITSYFLKELGRPVELFGRTAILRETKALMIASDGKPQSGEVAYQPRDHSVRIVEFETPAQIICDRRISAAEKYKKAYFDLVSTGCPGDSSDVSVHLYFRIVGPPQHQRTFTRLDVTIGQAAIELNRMTIGFALQNVVTEFTVGVEISLRQKKDQSPVTTTVRLLQSDGKLQDIVPMVAHPLILARSEKTSPGLFVSVEATGPEHIEFWTDVSLLHSPNVCEPISLDFGWFFSPSSEADPTVSVSPIGLNSMTEAQARVIAVSPPIPIVRH